MALDFIWFNNIGFVLFWHQQHDFCFVPASTRWLLFSSGILTRLPGRWKKEAHTVSNLILSNFVKIYCPTFTSFSPTSSPYRHRDPRCRWTDRLYNLVFFDFQKVNTLATMELWQNKCLKCPDGRGWGGKNYLGNAHLDKTVLLSQYLFMYCLNWEYLSIRPQYLHW